MNVKSIDRFKDTLGARNVLVIEDSPGEHALIGDFLVENKHEFNLTHVQSYKEANVMLSGEHLQFDVIVLDLSLPDKAGIELVNEIVTICQATPIIVLTGYESLRFGIKFLSMGIADYLFLKDELTPEMLYKSILYTYERKKVIQDFEEAKKRYSNLFHSNPEPMWVYAIDDLCIADVNEAAIKHYGYSKDEFLNMTINDIKVHEIYKPAFKNDAPCEVFDSDNIFEENIMVHRKKNGELISVEENTVMICHKGKKAKVVFAKDISERLNYVAAIEAQNEKLREIAWMQSHVVRAPLSRLMGLIDLFKNYQNTPEENAMIADNLLTCAHELDSIIKEISEKIYEHNNGRPLFAGRRASKN